jgi:hypothetical protein
VVIAYFGFVVGTKTAITDIKGDIKAIKENCAYRCQKMDSIDGMLHRLSQLESSIEVFWKMVGPHLANVIHSPTHHRRDELVEKLTTHNSPSIITLDEAQELLPLLATGREEIPDSNKKVIFSMLMAQTINKITYLQDKEKYDGT